MSPCACLCLKTVSLDGLSGMSVAIHRSRHCFPGSHPLSHLSLGRQEPFLPRTISTKCPNPWQWWVWHPSQGGHVSARLKAGRRCRNQTLLLADVWEHHLKASWPKAQVWEFCVSNCLFVRVKREHDKDCLVCVRDWAKFVRYIICFKQFYPHFMNYPLLFLLYKRST